MQSDTFNHNSYVSVCFVLCWWCCKLNWHLIVSWFMINTGSVVVLLGDVTFTGSFINFSGDVCYPKNMWYDYIPLIQVHIDTASCTGVYIHHLWKIFVCVCVKCVQIREKREENVREKKIHQPCTVRRILVCQGICKGMCMNSL